MSMKPLITLAIHETKINELRSQVERLSKSLRSLEKKHKKEISELSKAFDNHDHPHYHTDDNQ